MALATASMSGLAIGADDLPHLKSPQVLVQSKSSVVGSGVHGAVTPSATARGPVKVVERAVEGPLETSGDLDEDGDALSGTAAARRNQLRGTMAASVAHKPAQGVRRLACSTGQLLYIGCRSGSASVAVVLQIQLRKKPEGPATERLGSGSPGWPTTERKLRVPISRDNHGTRATGLDATRCRVTRYTCWDKLSGLRQ